MTAHPFVSAVVAGTFGLAVVVVCSAAAQTAAPPPPKCDAPEYRQFDFWVGSWDVTMRGQPAGGNLVTLEEGGCLVHEHWTGKGGGTGQSFNFFDRDDGAWHQVWVSNTGSVLYLTGHYADGTLTYLGETRRPDGTSLRHRLSFHPNGDGTVRQLWETSSDSGATWAVSFDGHYTKRKG
jgi:hypothetical protein